MGWTLVFIHLTILFFIRRKVRKQATILRGENAKLVVENTQLKGKINYLKQALLSA